MRKIIIACLIFASFIVPGQLTSLMAQNPCAPFTKPTSQAEVTGRIQDCQRRRKNEDIISRAPDTVLFHVMRFGVVSVVRLADPINLGTGLILLTLILTLSRRWKD